jgi:hypothetical protein
MERKLDSRMSIPQRAMLAIVPATSNPECEHQRNFRLHDPVLERTF